MATHPVQSLPLVLLPTKGDPRLLKPLNDMVLMELEEVEDYAKHKGLSRIIVPDLYSHGPEDRPVWGRVVAVGKKCLKIVKRGDRIVIGKWDGAKQEYKGKKYCFVREDAILGVDA